MVPLALTDLMANENTKMFVNSRNKTAEEIVLLGKPLLQFLIRESGT
jgi:hypothetical protein